jgi:hypothetical protein
MKSLLQWSCLYLALFSPAVVCTTCWIGSMAVASLA